MSLDPKARDMQYRVYGLTLCSDTPLTELQSSAEEPEGAADIRIWFSGHASDRPDPSNWFMSWSLSSGEPWLSCAKVGNQYLLRFPGLADFVVDVAGRDIIVMADSETPSDTLRHLLLDQVLPLVLNLQGHEALHATAVLTPRGVCAFMGPAGTGKSTLAASFLLAGYPVISDDCLVLEEDSVRIVAPPAYPGLRLWDDAVEALDGSCNRLRPVAHYTSKRRLVPEQLQEESFPGPHPVARIYSLARTIGAEVSSSPKGQLLTPLSFRDGFMELITAAFRLDITDRTMLVRQFLFYERVVSHVSVRRLQVPNTFSSLPAVREAILADLNVG